MTTQQYKFLRRSQETLLKEFNQLKAKLSILGSLWRFEELAKKGRKFAKTKKITPTDILKND